jgi:CAAX prenyl protease-like protein
VLVFYWRQYDFGKRGGTGLALAAGLVVLGLWIAPQAILGVGARVDGFDPSVFGEGSGLYWMTVAARFARLVIIVPLVEEIFWRGFLMRYLIREDFTSLPVGAFQWKSFAAVAVCFMLVHGMADWPAALLCGVIYNFVAVRTGILGACVLAHGVTNLGLGLYIMTTRQWGFW